MNPSSDAPDPPELRERTSGDIAEIAALEKLSSDTSMSIAVVDSATTRLKHLTETTTPAPLFRALQANVDEKE